MKRLVAETRAADARRRHPDPAESRRLVARARRAPAPPTSAACRANGDHISPEHPFPSPNQVRKRLAADGDRPDRAAVRLPAVHRPGVDRAGRARRDHGQVLVVHPAPRLRPPRGPAGPPRPRARRRSPAAARERRCSAEELTALFAESAREAIEDLAPGRRRAARRARGRRRHLRRQPQHQRLEHLHRRLRVLRLRPEQALAGRLRALPRGVRAGGSPRRSTFGATELCIQCGIHPDWDLEDYGAGSRSAKELAPRAPPARLLADGDRPHGRRLRAGARRDVLRLPARRRARLDARHRGRGAPRRRPRAHLARTSCPVARWVEIIEAATPSACARPRR